MDAATLDPEVILRYIVPDKGDEESKKEEILASRDSLETILTGHDGKVAEISQVLDHERASEIFNEFLEQVVEQQKQVKVVYYQPAEAISKYDQENSGRIYAIEDEDLHIDYLFIPQGVSIQRVSQETLGPGVLGRTWIGTGYIEILDRLYGAAFEEVALHEVNHLLYPHENEREIRARTKSQVQFPQFH
ncbi:hypothetical protein ACFL1B_04215 [Nanoarchaeota archaeon]